MQPSPPSPSPPSLPAEPYPFLDLLVTLLVFLAVILAAWLAARWLMRRMYGPQASPGGRIRVVERVPLEPRRTLYLVEAGEKLLLIGSTDHDVRVLAEFGREQLPAPPASERRSFLDALRAVAGRRPGGPDGTTPS
ncbi:MAG: flagellar biosynthetic protein FliO [Deltaproteobacteria bacterium]|nr:flagellar biosynthetic protein FliO [Deltaproteobacteria bacterium]